MNAVIRQDKYTRYEAHVALRTPQIVMELEATHEALQEAHGEVRWTAAMSRAYQTRDSAELGHLIAEAIHQRIAAVAADKADGEASERYDV